MDARNEPRPQRAADDRHARDRRVVRTRKAIREAFLRLMEDQDYGKITIAAIAREADIDRKTFYLHYDSVDGLVDEIVNDEAEMLLGVCREVAASGKGIIDSGGLFRQLSLDLGPDLPTSRRLIRHLSIEDWLRRIEGPLVEGFTKDNLLGLEASGEYLPYCMSFFCAGLIAIYRRWLLDASDVPLEDLSKVADIALTRGVDGVVEVFGGTVPARQGA